MIRTIIRLIRGAGQPAERLSERDGFLSYSAEVHAIVHGLFDGLGHRAIRPPKDLPDDPDIQKEPHYYKGGYLFGTVVQWAALAALGATGLGFL